jgi:hypothetical protein
MKKTSMSESAFFIPRLVIGSVFCLVGTLLALLALGLLSGGSASAQGSNQNQIAGGLQVVASYQNDVSPPLRDLPAWTGAEFKQQHEANENPKVPYRHHDSADPVIQHSLGAMLDMVAAAANLPGPILNFDGIPFPGVGCNCAPPDPNGAVGKTQYVQIVNEGYQVFDKATGASVLGPNSISSVWTGFG